MTAKKPYRLDDGPTLICPRCNKPFQQRFATQRFCSPICRLDFHGTVIKQAVKLQARIRADSDAMLTEHRQPPAEPDAS